MNPHFEKYKPGLSRWFDKGKLLEVIKDRQWSEKRIEMEEHKTNLYGDLITAALVFGVIIFMFSFEVETNGNDLAFYLLVGFFILVATVLTVTAIKKINDPANRSNLIVDETGIQYFDSIKSNSFSISWIEVEDVAIKYYENRQGFSVYLLVLNKDEKVKGLDISYLYPKAANGILKEDFRKIMNVEDPKYIELRRLIGHYLWNYSH